MTPRRRTSDPVLAAIRALEKVDGLPERHTRRGIWILLGVAREALGRGHKVSLYASGKVSRRVADGSLAKVERLDGAWR